MNFLKSAICLLLFLGVSGEAEKSSLPQIRQNGEVKQFFVDGKPFIMLAGELHNSSASSIEYMQPIWDRLSALHLNTVIGTASWELVEPEEGKFDFSLVDAQIKEARKRNMRLVLIWFATWKNAGSSYVPYWVKADRKRFPPMVLKFRPDGRLATYLAKSMEQQGTGPLTPFGKETLKADARAFRALMKHIKEVDPQHTVVMMHVENEMGSVGDSRDRSSLAEAAWAEPVPAELMNYLAKHKSTLLPEMQKLWEKNGFKQEGSWEEVFGKDEWADEVFMAYYMGRYVNAIVTEGKAELNVPMYVNAWLGPQPKAELPGQWPAVGGHGCDGYLSSRCSVHRSVRAGYLRRHRPHRLSKVAVLLSRYFVEWGRPYLRDCSRTRTGRQENRCRHVGELPNAADLELAWRRRKGPAG